MLTPIMLLLLLHASAYNASHPVPITTEKEVITPDLFFRYSLGFGTPLAGNFEMSNLNILVLFNNRWSIGAFGSLQIIDAKIDLPQLTEFNFLPLKYGMTGNWLFFRNNFVKTYFFGNIGNAYFLPNNFPNETYRFNHQYFNYAELGVGTYLFVNKGDNEKSGFYVDFATQLFTRIIGNYQNTRSQVDMDFDLSIRTFVMRLGFKLNLYAIKALETD
jgi:hypothetical protein